MAEYEKRWRREIGKELKTGMFAHQILTKLNDAQLNKIADIVLKPKTTALIKKWGDIDYPSSLIRKFFLHTPTTKTGRKNTPTP